MNVMMSSIPTLSPALSLEGYGVDDVDLLLDALFADQPASSAAACPPLRSAQPTEEPG
jgi:hypothetical protein